VEEVIAGIWGEVLGVGRVGARDNFFELGGHSLLIIQVQRRLREKLNRDIPIVDLFTYPTVSALAAHLSRASDEPESFGKVKDRAQKQKKAKDDKLKMIKRGKLK
jgi:acyl carrier protein